MIVEENICSHIYTPNLMLPTASSGRIQLGLDMRHSTHVDEQSACQCAPTLRIELTHVAFCQTCGPFLPLSYGTDG
jgi:hypothetical protein